MGVLGTVGGDGNGAIATAHSGSVCAQWVAGAFFGGGEHVADDNATGDLR